MIFGWLKRLMPQGLYGRAALILILPIVTLQLVVSILFIQRHYEGVTEQMTSNIVVGLRYVLDEVNEAGTPDAAQTALAALLAPLSLRAGLPADPAAMPASGVLREWSDLTGRAVIATLRAELEPLRAVDLVSGRREVRLWLDTRHGLMQVVLDRRRVSASNPHQLLVIVIFTGFLMTLIAFLFLRNQVRPIRRLAAASEAFGKGRHVPYRPQGATEVRAAGRAFLEMRDRLERQIVQRTQMLSAVSHDLRTPITRMKLALAMLRDEPETAGLLRDVEEMERLVNAFLDYARGTALDDPVASDPVQLVRDAVDSARRAGQVADLVEATGEGALVELRPRLIARALDNLIGNAVRYGNRAAVSVAVTPDAVRMTVEDDGPGIPEKRREEALLPFIRLDEARNQNRGAGVGLGLAIVADAVRGHGGTLTLGHSARLGGLKADIILPR